MEKKTLHKVNRPYGKVSHTLNVRSFKNIYRNTSYLSQLWIKEINLTYQFVLTLIRTFCKWELDNDVWNECALLFVWEKNPREIIWEGCWRLGIFITTGHVMKYWISIVQFFTVKKAQRHNNKKFVSMLEYWNCD